MTNWKRRRFFQAALAAGSAPLLGWRGALGQSADRTMQPSARAAASGPSGVALLRAPRRALVIGNSGYPDAPLRNPANDARAIAEQLKRTGFEVTLGIDWRRSEMFEAIGEYGHELARRRPVGLFYFAGHGVQLAWRNYLVPVDAAIERMEDVQTQCVDVNAVIERMGKASNPMNMIILDACRDNPFRRDFRIDRKGLSQLDAPPGTLLAYATSPGNVASDGEGANGLYTENLLREIGVPEAKIEDVFKRVRLAVRRRSNGRQIPWESTSLEEDFWFIPPKDLKKLSEEEAERAYREELSLWERTRDAAEPGPFEEYLKRYPSGRFAELAQLYLDRALARQGEKKIEIVAPSENPYTKGFAAANTGYRVGDSYTYHQMDLYSRVVSRTVTNTITEITDREVIYDGGRMVTDLLGNLVRHPDGRRFSSSQFYPTEFRVGKRWTTRFVVIHPQGGEFNTELEMRISGRERITVPAGTFDCFILDAEGRSAGQAGSLNVGVKAWFAPDRVRRPVARNDIRAPGGRIRVAERMELAAFRQA